MSSLIYKNPDCGCSEQEIQIGMASVLIHVEPNGIGEAFIDFGDWDEEKTFECSGMDDLLAKVKQYISSLPPEG